MVGQGQAGEVGQRSGLPVQQRDRVITGRQQNRRPVFAQEIQGLVQQAALQDGIDAPEACGIETLQGGGQDQPPILVGLAGEFYDG